MTASELHFAIPGLLGPVPEPVRSLPELRDLPALSELLSRGARGSAGRGLDGLLAGLFGSSPERAPMGPVSLLGEGRALEDGYWFRAAPLHLRADRDRVMVFGGGMLELAADEEAVLVDAFNDFFAEDGLRLESHAGGWYLRVARAPDLRTQPLHKVLGTYLDESLPAGADARYWNKLLNEVQMLFHGQAINELREQRRALPVNGLWIWGGGTQPERLQGGWDWVYSDEPYARGLAGLGGAAVAPRPRRLPEAGGRRLLVLDEPLQALTAGEIGDWLDALQRLERDWLQPALEGLRRGEWQAIGLHVDEGSARRLGRGSRWRFWRRRRPLGSWLRIQEQHA